MCYASFVYRPTVIILYVIIVIIVIEETNSNWLLQATCLLKR